MCGDAKLSVLMRFCLFSLPLPSRFSAMGRLAKIFEGTRHVDILNPNSGVVRWGGYKDDPQLQASMQRIVGNQSASIFTETFSQQLEMTLRTSESLGAILDSTTTTAPFEPKYVSGGQGDGITSQFKQTAKVIKARAALGSERDVFFLSVGSFDTHSDLSGKLSELFQYVMRKDDIVQLCRDSISIWYFPRRVYWDILVCSVKNVINEIYSSLLAGTSRTV